MAAGSDCCENQNCLQEPMRLTRPKLKKCCHLAKKHLTCWQRGVQLVPLLWGLPIRMSNPMSAQDFTSFSLPECQERSVLCSAKGWSTCLSSQPSIKEMMISLSSSNFLIMCNLSNLGQIPSFCIRADLSRSCLVGTDEGLPRVRSYLLPLGQPGRILPSPEGEQGCMFVALGSGGLAPKKSLVSVYLNEQRHERVKGCFSTCVIPRGCGNQELQMRCPLTNSKKKCPNTPTSVLVAFLLMLMAFSLNAISHPFFPKCH